MVTERGFEHSVAYLTEDKPSPCPDEEYDACGERNQPTETFADIGIYDRMRGCHRFRKGDPNALHRLERRQIHRIVTAPTHPFIGNRLIIRLVQALDPVTGILQSYNFRRARV